jgi:hypothetical protein
MNNKQDKREILGIQATIVDETKAGRPSVQTRQIYADGVAVDRKMGEDGLFVRVSELPLKLMGIIETLVNDAVDKLDEAPAIISYAEGRNRYFTLNGRHYCTAFLDEGNRFESPFDKELRKLMSVLYLFKETFGGVSLNEIDYDSREDALSPESELVLSLGRAAFEGKDWSKMSYRSIVHLAYEVASATSGWMIPDSDSAETGDPEGELYALASKAISDSLLENPSKTDMERNQDVLSGIFIGKGHAPYGVAALWASLAYEMAFLSGKLKDETSLRGVRLPLKQKDLIEKPADPLMDENDFLGVFSKDSAYRSFKKLQKQCEFDRIGKDTSPILSDIINRWVFPSFRPSGMA